MIFKHPMSNSWMFVVFILISFNQSIDSSYHYAGCFTQVFRESFFTSSFMEPTLCFRLCDTPIIYLQGSICRCSGGGLMDQNRQNDKYCTIPCTKPADRQVNTANTCGGQKTYSAYVEEEFYMRHGHLFNYQINFLSCELWKNTDVYETLSINLNAFTTDSSLNQMERCAAACLDQNTTTKSIAFNGDNNQCLCIMPWKASTAFQRLHYLTILPNTSCNRYCNNTVKGSKVDQKFRCGSLTEPRTWAIYDLNGTCPADFVYIKELKKCVYAYKSFWGSCTLPAKTFVYDDSLTWNNLLKMIETLKLNQSLVTIDFDDDIVVNSSWKCPSAISDVSSSYYSRSHSSYYSWNANTRYILDDGCLRESSYSSYSHRYSTRLCITEPINKYSLSSDDENNSAYATAITPQIKYCPTHWFDLNGYCYRMSDERKTIHDARISCITVSKNETNKNEKKSPLWSDDENDDDENDDNENDDDQLNDSPKGDIVQYTSEWQTRLGFFLLDTIPESDVFNSGSSTPSLGTYYEDLPSLASDVEIYHPIINEFQMINPTENNNSSITNGSCVISTRTIIEDNERPVLKSNSLNNCSIARHVLCETKTLIVRNFQQGCFQKPLTLDLPALISNRLTFELCLSVCQELQTKLAVIHMDKCYCLNGFTSKIFNLTVDLGKYQQQDCGNPCSGNQHERCGDDDTIIIFHILDSRHSYPSLHTPVEPFPDFIYDGCINITSFNPATTYQFNFNDKNNVHPRHCLELCRNRQQKYALLNSNKCFCTNIPIKSEEYNNDILLNQYCSQKCAGSYFYTCGNEINSTIYSMYLMQPKCRHGYEVAENDQQCIYSHLSVKKNSYAIAQSYCKSIGGVNARINNILEIQDILPQSILNTRFTRLFPLFYHIKSLSDPKYFWIDRTTDIPGNNTISERLLSKCSEVSDIIDQNCLVVRYERNVHDNLTIYQRCIAESNQCSNTSAMPVCVDQHLENNSTLILPFKSEEISSPISIDYSCGDDLEYHFVDDYCYKIFFHENSWNNAKAECESENAMLFVPEKSITLQIIKSLFLHGSTYTSSGFAHVGVIYDKQNQTVIQYNTTDGKTVGIVPDSNTVYDLCEKTFNERYAAVMSSTSLSINERNRLKKQQLGCAYIDLLTYTVPVIRCDEIPCDRTATVICQKLPILKTDVIKANREMIKTPSGVLVTDDQSNNDSPDFTSTESTKSIGRDFAPIFFILAILFALILLGFISTIYNHRLYQKNNHLFQSGRHNNNSIYSPLTSGNDFDLT